MFIQILIPFQFFYLEFPLEELVILSPILTSICHENITEIPLPSKKRLQANIFLVDAWSQAFFSREKQVFRVVFFFNIRDISG